MNSSHASNISPLTIVLEKDEQGKTKSYFTGHTTVELVDAAKLARVVNSPRLLSLQEKLKNNEVLTLEDLTLDGCVMPRPHSKNFVSEIMKYQSQVTSSGKVNIQWAGCEDVPIGYGRVFPLKGQKSFINLWRPVRGFLAKGIYLDFDIENCHPTAIVQKCHQANIECSALNDYCLNREARLADVMKTYGVDRDCAKQLFLILSYGGGFQRWLNDFSLPRASEPTPFITAYKDNFKLIGEEFIQANPELVNALLDREDKETTVNSVISYVAQTWERQALEVMHKYLVKKKMTTERNCVLCYDGIMIKTSAKLTEKLEETMRGIEDEIRKELGFNFRITNKEFDNSLGDILEEIDDLTTSYRSIKEGWEKQHFKCTSTAQFFEVKDGTVLIRDRQKYRTSYEHLEFLDTDGEHKKFIDRWMKDCRMRTYEGYNYYMHPQKVPQNHFNMFLGFEVQRSLPETRMSEDVDVVSDRSQSSKLSVILDHIKMLCNNVEAHYNYFLSWIAQMFQEPGTKTNVAGVFKSQQGIGKDAMARLIGLMLGSEYYLNTSEIERDIFGDFNDLMSGRVLVVCNEAKFSSKFDTNLKDLITNTQININAKFQGKFVANNNSRFLFFSNFDLPVRIEPSDRRFFTIETNQSMPAPEYFTRLMDCIEDPVVRRAFYDFLMARDISQVDWKMDRPITEFYEQSRILSLDSTTSFLIDQITDWALNADSDTIECSVKELFALYEASSYSSPGKSTKWVGNQISQFLKRIPGHGDGIGVKRISGVCQKVRTFNLRLICQYLVDQSYVESTILEHFRHRLLAPIGSAQPEVGGDAEEEPVITYNPMLN